MAEPGGIGAGAATLTLDGQSDTDYRHLHHRQPRIGTHLPVNVLDTGASNNGVDDSRSTASTTNPFFNGYVTGTTTRNATDDISCCGPRSASTGRSTT
jgi:hypothetical protein